MPNKTKTIFALPEDKTVSEIIYDILRANNLEESVTESVAKSLQGIESKSNTLIDLSYVLAEKKIPEQKAAELLSQHLDTSIDTATKIVTDIKQKLLPYAKTIPNEEPKKVVAKPIPPPTAKLTPPKLPYKKEVAFPNVEENAQHMEKSETLEKARTVIPQPPTQPTNTENQDAYREPIE